MTHPDQMFHKLESLTAVERKEYEELKASQAELDKRKREQDVFYGFCIVGIVSALVILGFLNSDQIQYYLR